ncbi:MAG: DUF4445 domain-containing protein [Candidatus Hydrogenedentes bacterium]|nr:DUF4445 domain-containing protein [Candidatus Hydrogenedentota bacterium]
MIESEVSVTFEPQGRMVRVRPGVTVREAATRAGVFLDYPCGGQGTCGKCRVKAMAGLSEPASDEQALLTPEELTSGIRLACRAAVVRPVVVTVPDKSLLSTTYKILADSSGPAAVGSDPPVRRVHVEMNAPTLEDDAADLERLLRHTGPLAVGRDVLSVLPAQLRQSGFCGEAIAVDGELIAFDGGVSRKPYCVAAFDIGTTTLVGVLLDPCTGVERARASRMNPQTSLGDDVLSRILHTRQHMKGLEELRAMAVAAVNEMCLDLAARAGITPQAIVQIIIAGNTTMQHLFAGLDPGALGEVPFVPAASRSLRIPAKETGISIHPRGSVYVFPVIGGFVGGDTVAGMLTTNIAESQGPVMLIDIGTNGELVLHRDGILWATSCAAGPAFEGARISHGMRAAEGAIEEFIFEDDVRWSVIGDVRPAGICGSALIDAAAGLLRLGIVLPQGLMLEPGQLPDNLPEAIRRRVVSDASGTRFVLVEASETSIGSAIELTQADVRELQLAIAAIRAGFTILLRRAELGIDEVEHVLVAGAFGNYIRCENAQRIGLLPHGLPPSKLAFVGNTSLSGAHLAALSLSARERAESLAQRTHHVDLSLDPHFHEAYVEAMFFPEEDATEMTPSGRP